MKNISLEKIGKVTIGTLLVAIGFIFFLVPNEIAPGGLSGLALVITSYVPQLNIGSVMFMMNIILIILGITLIGKSFGGMTIYGAILLSSFMYIFEELNIVQQSITGDLFIEMVLGTVISSIGMAIVFNENASTGGTDIAAKILNKYTKFNIGKSLLVVDLMITILAINTFGIQKGVYALLGVFITGNTVDYVVNGFNLKKKVEIMTKEKDAVREYIVKTLGKGATIYTASGGYTGEEKSVIVTILDKKDFIRLKEFIEKTDKEAFTTTYNVSESFGGFSLHSRS